MGSASNGPLENRKSGVRKNLEAVLLLTAKIAGNKKPAEAGLYQDHSNSLSAAFPAMVDRP
ncbi:hypothetical protein [Pseudomonas syringae]|uniref:hypothetical protein n=1 Tax=Pseudomonas syringae TaxID=317 RepID=UPI000AB9077D|nr:hypothetical protein [Pseudomonas syringae]